MRRKIEEEEVLRIKIDGSKRKRREEVEKK
jgi:hypothetical protein